MTEFEKAIALDPNSFEGHYFYARACFAEGKLERAAALFERAAEIKPDDYQSLMPADSDLSFTWAARPRKKSAARKGIERAEQRAQRFIRIIRGPAYLGASALITLGESDRAKEWLARALAIDPDDVLTQYNAACIYSRLGKPRPGISICWNAFFRTPITRIKPGSSTTPISTPCASTLGIRRYSN